ncbi:MAG: S-layer homology domain-containing protein [Oscillospiraceae bacterium]|jgi:hypothetical protein
MGKQKRRFVSALLAGLIAFTCSPLSPAARAYTDTDATWAAEVIEKAGTYGLMEGYPDGRFGVGENMSRAEFVTVLGRMFGWQSASPAAPTYIDCPASAWYYSAVETAAAHDVTDPGGAFRPGDYISRAEMAQMLVRALGYSRLAQSLSGAALPGRLRGQGVHRHRLRLGHHQRRGGQRNAELSPGFFRPPGAGGRHAGAHL